MLNKSVMQNKLSLDISSKSSQVAPEQEKEVWTFFPSIHYLALHF